jgi:Carboxypeptidase regulatory-like domain/TonB-dependent Receptor Plug Domain
MDEGLSHRIPRKHLPYCIHLLLILLSLGAGRHTYCQTVSTGAVIGVTSDPSGAVVSGVVVHVLNDAAGEVQSTISDENGWFGFLLLPPGQYQLDANKTDFEPVRLSGISIHVTETLRLILHLQLAAHLETAQVSSSDPLMVQLDSSSLGRVVNKNAVDGLPLVTRSFAQITGLSPGVIVGVYNAGELGLGGTALSQIAKSNDGVFVHGLRSYDNNWQLDGLSVSDVQGSASGSGGIPLPNPDTIEEFKVQTGLYDADFGRYAGANTSVLTKTGGSEYHGTAFEFFRNNVLNANDFFLNEAGKQRADLKQNQFGFTLGGPVKKEKLFFLAPIKGRVK